MVPSCHPNVAAPTGRVIPISSTRNWQQTLDRPTRLFAACRDTASLFSPNQAQQFAELHPVLIHDGIQQADVHLVAASNVPAGANDRLHQNNRR